MKDLLKDIQDAVEVEAIDVLGKVLVIRTETKIPKESLELLQKYYQEKGAMGVIILRNSERIEILSREQLQSIGFKAVDFLSELEEL